MHVFAWIRACKCACMYVCMRTYVRLHACAHRRSCDTEKHTHKHASGDSQPASQPKRRISRKMKKDINLGIQQAQTLCSVCGSLDGAEPSPQAQNCPCTTTGPHQPCAMPGKGSPHPLSRLPAGGPASRPRPDAPRCHQSDSG